MNELVISGSIECGKPPEELQQWGPSPLLKAARVYSIWKSLLDHRVSFQEVTSSAIDAAAAVDALRYSFIKLTPVEAQKGPMPCQRIIDLS